MKKSSETKRKREKNKRDSRAEIMYKKIFQVQLQILNRQMIENSILYVQEL